MPHATPALDSLDAWPGETARPPLRLLAPGRPNPRRAVPAEAPSRPVVREGWLARMRLALLGAPRAGLTPSPPPEGAGKLGAALRFLEMR